MSPEVATGTWFRGLIANKEFRGRLKLLTIDEAHLVFIWGDFRAYEWLWELTSADCKAQLLLTSATLTRSMLEAIMLQYGVNRLHEVRESVFRKGIFLDRRLLPGRPRDGTSRWYIFNTLIEKMKHGNFPRTLILARSHNDCDSIFEYLEGFFNETTTREGRKYQNCRVLNLHAAQASEIRNFLLTTFVKGKGRTGILVATSVMDVGTNFKDIGCLIQVHVPARVEQFVQRIGRPGRDGLPAYTVAYTDMEDQGKRVSPEMRTILQNKEKCVNKVMFGFLGENAATGAGCSCCDVCQAECIEEKHASHPDVIPLQLRGYFPEAVRPSPGLLPSPTDEDIELFRKYLRAELKRPECDDDLQEYVDAYEEGENLLEGYGFACQEDEKIVKACLRLGNINGQHVLLFKQPNRQ